MQTTDAIGAEDVARAAAAVSAHRGSALPALAFDVLSRQAEGRALFVGKKHVESLAEEHGVLRDEADTERGNVLEILTRGPTSAEERALVAAFAVAGLSPHLDKNEPTSLTTFVRHADWLEAATPYAVYAFVDRVLSDADASRIWNAVADASVGAEANGIAHGTRASSALRVAALASSQSDAAADALARVAKHAADPSVRAAAAFAIGGDIGGRIEAPDEARRAIRVRGVRGRPRGGPVREAARIASGWALVSWCARLLLALTGVERSVEALLVRGGIEMREKVTLLGRVVREQEELVPIAGLARLSRDVRYPALHLLIGLTTLSAGVLIGGIMVADAVRSGATWFLVLGAAIIVVGAGLDLALDVLVPARKRHVAIELASSAGSVRRIEGVPPDAAERFVRAVQNEI
jgi:hypothetical protein